MIEEPPAARPSLPVELTLTTGPPANGGSCVARHEGRVVFVRYALPAERVRVRVVADHGSYWHADVVEVLEASPDRVDSLCPIAGVDGAGCCDLAFAAPEAARRLKGAVVANQLARAGRVSLARRVRRGRRTRSAPARPPAGAPGSGWTPPTTAAQASTATTARSWSPTCGADSCRRRRSTV